MTTNEGFEPGVPGGGPPETVEEAVFGLGLALFEIFDKLAADLAVIFDDVREALRE